MTSASAFHFASLVWDWPIAIYLFLIGISAGLVTLAILLRRFHPEAGGSDSTLLRTTLVLGPGAIILGLLILVFHLTRPWTFWKLMFHYSFTSVMSMGVMLFQLYMVVLVLWLAKIFEKEVIALQQRWLPRSGIVQKVLTLIAPFHRALETLMLVLAVLLGAYTGFLLSALKSYPFLNNPILPALFLFSGISSGAAVALIAMALRHRSNPHSTEARFVHRIETPVVWLEIFLLAAFFIGLALGDDGARIFNAVVAYGCELKEITQYCDSFTICLSKGLGTPVGSLLVGNRDYIKRATRWRKMVGGGMRQAGILAAAGLYALKHNVARLQEDHDNAAWLAQQLREAGAEVIRHETNMLFVRVGEAQAAALGDYLRERNILINAAPIVRLVTHLDVSREQLTDVVAHWRAFLAR